MLVHVLATIGFEDFQCSRLVRGIHGPHPQEEAAPVEMRKAPSTGPPRKYEKVEVDDVWAYLRRPVRDCRLGEGIVA